MGTDSVSLDPPSQLQERRPQLREFRLQLRRHLLRRRLPDEPPQLFLEAVALTAVLAQVQVLLGKGTLLFVQIAVQERLQHLFALVARIDCESAHSESPPSTSALSASSRFKMRRPRCRRDITVPTGMSRICAASL